METILKLLSTLFRMMFYVNLSNLWFALDLDMLNWTKWNMGGRPSNASHRYHRCHRCIWKMWRLFGLFIQRRISSMLEVKIMFGESQMAKIVVGYS